MRSRVAACLAFALAQSAVADSGPVYPGGETVVTAARVEQKLSDALRSVVVITAQDIEESGQLTLAQLLQLRGGVEMASNGGHGQPASVFIRGANSAHTLVLVDGLRLQSATTGTTAFENIPLAQVERIEIVSGPVSGLYGSDAIGGVIQIFTRSGHHSPATAATAALGSDRTGSLSAASSGAAGSTDYTLAAAHFTTGGFDATRPTISFDRHNPDDDGYTNTNFSAKLTHRFAPGQEIGASALYSKGDAHFDNAPDTDDHTEQTLSSYSIYGRNQVSAAWQSLVRVGTGRDDSASLGGAFPGRFRTDEHQALWQNTLRFGDTTLIAGLEYLAQEVATSNAYAVNRRTIRSAFAGVSGDYGSHAVEANVRRDDNSQFGTPTSGSLAYGLRFAPDAKIRAAYGKAFHAPSFNDLYFPGFGNPDLRPEVARNREIGVDYQVRGQRFSATYFDNGISGLIVFVFDPVTFEGKPINVARARIRGIEMSWQARWLDTAIQARLTVQDPKSEDTGFQLQRRAKRHGSIVAARDFGAWHVGAEMLASGARFDSPSEAPATRLGGYAVVNLTLARRLSPAWAVELRWNNVANRDYELVQGFNTPGSNAMLSLKWAVQ